MTVSVLSAVFLSKYDFTGISSVLGIIVILEKSSQSDTFSWRTGMTGLFSSHVSRRVGERWNNECLQPWWGCISASGVGDIVRIDGITNAEKYRQVLMPSGQCLIGNVLELFAHFLRCFNVEDRLKPFWYFSEGPINPDRNYHSNLDARPGACDFLAVLNLCLLLCYCIPQAAGDDQWENYVFSICPDKIAFLSVH